VKACVLILGILVTGITLSTPASSQPRVTPLPRVVLITNSDEPGFRPFRNSFLQGMTALGHSEGRTFQFEVLLANREPARAAILIREAILSQPDVLVVSGLTNARRARDATTTVPVVVATASDLVDSGVVASLARPGGNITGITDLADEGSLKRLELLREALPKLRHVALLTNPDFPATAKIVSRIGAAAQTYGITVVFLHAKDRAALKLVVDSLRKSRPDALLVGSDALFTVNARQLIEDSTALRVPVVHYWPGTAEMGAIFSYQVDIHRNYERAASYVDRILKGAKPRDLPVEQPTHYELVVNRKAATKLGIRLPQTLLLRADRMLE
jgi:ABC-type uncharacterized transport system substrate-binding protein